jgi:hypothetical protein
LITVNSKSSTFSPLPLQMKKHPRFEQKQLAMAFLLGQAG